LAFANAGRKMCCRKLTHDDYLGLCGLIGRFGPTHFKQTLLVTVLNIHKPMLTRQAAYS